jgi:hypothetical protein
MSKLSTILKTQTYSNAEAQKPLNLYKLL